MQVKPVMEGAVCGIIRGMEASLIKEPGQAEVVVYGSWTSPIGEVYAAVEGGAVAALSIAVDEAGFVGRLGAEFPWAMVKRERGELDRLFRILDRYFKGDAVDFRAVETAPRGTGFERMVWRALRDIPCGAVRTYGEVASAIGMPGAARAVGRACGANPVPIIIPCHRVVRSDGTLGGYSGGLWIKKALLEVEGRVPEDPS